MRHSGVKRNYREERNITLEDRAEGVEEGVYGNDKVFINPTMTKVAYHAILSDLIAKRKTYNSGGLTQKAPFKAAQDLMIATLDDLADFVFKVAIGDAEIVRLSGFDVSFDPASTGSAIGETGIHGLTLFSKANISGELQTDCETKATGTYYIGILCEGGPLPDSVTNDAKGCITIPPEVTMKIRVNYDMKRQKKFTGLTSGVNYYAYYIIIIGKFISGLSNESKCKCW